MLFLMQSFGRPRSGGSMQKPPPMVYRIERKRDDDDELLLAAWRMFMAWPQEQNDPDR